MGDGPKVLKDGSPTARMKNITSKKNKNRTREAWAPLDMFLTGTHPLSSMLVLSIIETRDFRPTHLLY